MTTTIKTISTFILVLLLSVSCKQEQEAKVLFNDGWKFKLMEETESNDKTFHTYDYDDTQWEAVSLPHTAHLEPQVVNDQWQGICWYRKSFVVDAELKDKKVIFEFEAAMNHSKFWINGEEITIHQGGYLPVVFDATKYLKYGEDNIIAVRLNNKDNTTTGPKPVKILDFNMYGGLYRNAWMIVKNKVYITHPVLADKVASGGTFITFPKVSESQSTVKIKTHVQSDCLVDNKVFVNYDIYQGGVLVKTAKSKTIKLVSGEDYEFIDQINIENAKLWSPQSPNLYRVVSTVMIGEEIMDKEITRFGIREVVFKNNELYVNGKKTFLRGVNRHQEYPFVGYALSDNATYRDVKKMKEAGFDYIRLSHYPQSKALMEACDELGLFVADAILGWQYYNDTDKFRNYCYQSATDLIRRDRNHACVLAWEVSLNETKMPIFFMEELHRIVHAEYPENNAYSCGWMDDVYDIYFQARQHRIMHHYEHPTKPYAVSEYGDWEYHSNNAGLNQHKVSRTMRAEQSSRQLRSQGEVRLLNQARNVQEAHNDNFDFPTFADSYWVMFDYNRGYHDDLEASGLMDLFRLPKFGYYFYRSQRDAEEGAAMVNIATYWTKESPLDVRVFSNADEVKLSLNGNVIATQTPDTTQNTENLPHPPFTFTLDQFEAGELVAEAYIKGEKVAEHIVNTPQQASQLKLWIDESGKVPEAGCNDVVFLYIAAVDGNGTINPEFSEKITLQLGGDVEIMNPDDIVAEAGIATALIRIGNRDGKVSADATSGSLSGNLTFATK